MKKKKAKQQSSLIDAYKRVRKPAAPPEKVIPDKRAKIKGNEDDKDYEDYKASKNIVLKTRDQIFETLDQRPESAESKDHKTSKNSVRANVFVSGHVQGVYFRGTAQEKAVDAGLDGWVRNRIDGRVEAVLEGDKDAIRHMIDWFHIGPPAARVEQVEVFWESATGEYKGFEQRHTF